MLFLALTSYNTKLGWIPLEEDRARNKVTTLFKAINNITTLSIDNFSTIKVNTRRGNNKFLDSSYSEVVTFGLNLL